MRRLALPVAALALLVTVALLVASCAPVPRPVGTAQPPPPTGRPGPAGRPQALPPTAPATFDLSAEPTIDVGLAWDLDAIELRAGSRALLEAQGYTKRSKGVVSIALSGGQIAFENRKPSGKNADESRLGHGDTLWVGDPDSPSDTLVHWNGKLWRGRFKVFLNPRGKLTIVDRLPLETYLLGVVPGEIGALDEKLLEAGRAQAIAARSYTLFYRGRRAAEGFDIYGTVEDQVYGPVVTERSLATRCVQSTRGMLALSDGFPIRANYCSTCGGITAEVWEAWPAEPLPYLVSHADRGAQAGSAAGADFCAESPLYRWREQWTAGEFLADLALYAPQQGLTLPPGGGGELEDVRVDQRSRSGRVWRLVVATAAGEIAIPAYAIRQVLRRGGKPDAILKSNLFKIDVRRDPVSRKVLSVVATGAGSGHGVGLCQTGALGMARAGLSALAILEHYFHGALVRRFY